MGLKKFATGVIKEAKRVRWPKREVLIPSIIVVIIIAGVTGLLLFGEDVAGRKLIEILTDAFKGIKQGEMTMVDNSKTAFSDTNTDIGEESQQDQREQKLGEKAWYVVSTYSTHERKAAYNLQKRVESMGLDDLIFRIVVVEQEVPVMKDGLPTGKTRMKNLYPGYVFVEMIMTDYAWYIVRNTPGVTGFVGSAGKGTKPFPVPREQIEPVLKRMGMVDESMYDRYEVGDYIKVIHGTLEGTEGKILSINKDTGAVEIETVFFGRTTKVEVDFSEIEKI